MSRRRRRNGHVLPLASCRSRWLLPQRATPATDMQDGLFIVYMDEGTLQTESGAPVRQGGGTRPMRCGPCVCVRTFRSSETTPSPTLLALCVIPADRPNNTYISLQHVLLTGQPLPDVAPPAGEVEERQCAAAWCVLAWRVGFSPCGLLLHILAIHA